VGIREISYLYRYRYLIEKVVLEKGEGRGNGVRERRGGGLQDNKALMCVKVHFSQCGRGHSFQ
jgi:hypothetical protein